MHFIWKDKQKFQQWWYMWAVASGKYWGCTTQCFPRLWKKLKVERIYVHSILTLIFNQLKLKYFFWNIKAALYMNTRRRRRVSAAEMHSRHAETLHQHFPMKIPTQCVYVSLHQHFSNKPALTKTISLDSLWKETGCHSTSAAGKILCSTQITNTQLQIVPKPGATWCMGIAVFSQKTSFKWIQYEPVGNDWAEMDRFPEARTTSYSMTHSLHPI